MQTSRPFPQFGTEFRIASSRDGVACSQFWKFFVRGSDVYATVRSGGGMHFSIHNGEYVHLREGGKDKQVLAPPLPLSDPAWLHALEVRFLLTHDQFRPPKESLKGKKAYLVGGPPDRVLTLNLLVADKSVPKLATPQEFGSGTMLLWRATLSSGQHAVLVARLVHWSDQHRLALDEAREVKVNVDLAPDSEPYVELTRIDVSAHGSNVVTVIPRGPTALRAVRARLEGDDESTSRSVTIALGTGRLEVLAPDGRRAALIEIAAGTAALRLLSGVSDSGVIGVARLVAFTEGLEKGARFFTPTLPLKVPLLIDGVSVDDWTFSIGVRYEQDALTATIRSSSRGIENRYLSRALPTVRDAEGVIVAVPTRQRELTVGFEHAECSLSLECSATLYEIAP